MKWSELEQLLDAEWRAVEIDALLGRLAAVLVRCPVRAVAGEAETVRVAQLKLREAVGRISPAVDDLRKKYEEGR